jgi:hypothetical protein
MNRLLSLLIGVAILAGGAPLQAHATAFFATGNSPQQPGQENVLYTSTQTGTSIQGFLNQSNTAVSFTSGQTLQVTALGQANLTTIDNVINSVTIAIPGQTYDSIIFNPFVGQTGGGGTTTVTVLTIRRSTVTSIPWTICAPYWITCTSIRLLLPGIRSVGLCRSPFMSPIRSR